ncbi:MAG: tyrosine-type recombinase/integrase [Chloroflexota bacterium]|nr:tyrosine-type recombinase/integrase [Chloroflexota bacterium]
MKRPKRLSDTFVRKVNRPGRYGEGRGGLGLSLLVKERAGGGLAKSWSQRIRINGKPCNLGLGRYPIVTLATARERALENARAVDQGDDPRVGSRVPTFQEAAESVIRLHKPSWKPAGAATSEKNWRSSLRRFVYPEIGTMTVDAITTNHVHRVLVPIWNEKHETARRVGQRISRVMKWAMVQGYRGDNPASAVAAALPKSGSAPRHHRALHHTAVPAALHAVRESGAWLGTKLCFEFLVLTATRSSEARLATWDEVDRTTATWKIPGTRIKSGRPHHVPLSGRALELLDEAQNLSGGSGLLFPGPRGKALSNMTTSKLLKELGIEAVTHGFRSSFRDWAAECTDTPRAVCEAALAHVVGGVEGAYMRTDLFDRRRTLMDQWADYLSQESG